MNPYGTQQSGMNYNQQMPAMQPLPGSQNQQSPMYFQNPNIQVKTSPVTPYKSQYNANDPISSLINKIGGMLSPQKAFNQTMSYDQYANPQRAVFNQWAGDARKEFNRFTLDPFKQQYADSLAASGGNYMGNSAYNYQTDLRRTEQPFYDQQERARDSIEDMIRQGYNRQMTGYYDSPTAFNNLGVK